MAEELLSDDEAREVLKKILSLYPDAKGNYIGTVNSIYCVQF